MTNAVLHTRRFLARPTFTLSGALLTLGLLTVGALTPHEATAAAQAGATVVAAEDARVLQQIEQEVQARLPMRLALQAVFEEAYRRYPALPEGVLESVAFVGSRWIDRQPTKLFDGHHHMPQAWGVMGLFQGQGGYADKLGEAAAALNVSRSEVQGSMRLQVLGVAALLSARIEQEGLVFPRVEQLVPMLQDLSGLPAETEVQRFARLSYVYDVLLTLDRGHDDAGIELTRSPIAWREAFSDEELRLLRAPLVRVNVARDEVTLAGGPAQGPAQQATLGLELDRAPATSAERTTPQTTDYPPALWVASPNYSSRSGTAISAVAIHTVQGSYSSCISWFQNTSAQASAHYVVRSSDGQVTQMVLESNKAWHIGSENPYTLGTEHEGYVDTSSYYTTAMYNSSSALTKDMCSSNKIDCNTCYGGVSHKDVVVLSSSYKIKGHQHYPNQTHSDPGIYWDWAKYKSLVATSTGGGTTPTTTTTVLDSFESSEGHFNTAPTYSGSTVGVATSSTADRSTSAKKNGSYSEKLVLKDNTSSTANWEVRFLSGSGTPANNTALPKAGGRVGFWIYTTSSGLSAGLSADDSDGTERSVKKTVPTSTWTYLEWKLDDQAMWDSWSGGNGVIDNTTGLTLDAIWFYRNNTSSQAVIYIDDVTYSKVN